jgi:hypothetical protein
MHKAIVNTQHGVESREYSTALKGSVSPEETERTIVSSRLPQQEQRNKVVDLDVENHSCEFLFSFRKRVACHAKSRTIRESKVTKDIKHCFFFNCRDI